MLTEWDEAVAPANLLFTFPHRFNSLGSRSAFARLILFDKFVFPPTCHPTIPNKRVRLPAERTESTSINRRGGRLSECNVERKKASRYRRLYFSMRRSSALRCTPSIRAASAALPWDCCRARSISSRSRFSTRFSSHDLD